MDQFTKCVLCVCVRYRRLNHHHVLSIVLSFYFYFFVLFCKNDLFKKKKSSLLFFIIIILFWNWIVYVNVYCVCVCASNHLLWSKKKIRSFLIFFSSVDFLDFHFSLNVDLIKSWQEKKKLKSNSKLTSTMYIERCVCVYLTIFFTIFMIMMNPLIW